MDIRERLQIIVDTVFNGSRRGFASKIGVVPGTIDNVLGKRASKPSVDILEKIMQSIDGIDAEWLLTGNNRMFKQQTEETAVEQELKMCKALLENQNDLISRLKGEMEKLQDENIKYRKKLGLEERSVG